MKNIPTRYNPKDYEEKWASFWVDQKSFASSPDEREKYSIVIPPPNVTGVLHMGHALNNVLQDIIIRFNRMKDRNAMWMPGTDHGGIATQNVVEKQLYNSEKKTRHDLGRKEFLNRMWKWKEESGGTIINQLKRLGCGCDWDRLRFTMDDQCGKAVFQAFKNLEEKKLIYRGRRMTNWCIRCHTALADIEVENEEKAGKLWYIRYPMTDDPEKFLLIATTRPETMLGDTAVAVNPKDGRYGSFVGKKVILPLAGRTIPVIADDFVDMEFGTGCVKVTPEHDPNDDEIGQRHDLEEKIGRFVVIDKDGKIVNTGLPYDGMTRENCRKAVLNDLESAGLLEKTEDYKHAPGACYRCSTVIEPLKTRQWFLEMKDIAKAAADATRSGSVKFFPESWAKPYLNWLDNIRDWCLSRQIWWGHRIPIWYCAECEGKNLFPIFSEEYYAENPDISMLSYDELKKTRTFKELNDNAESWHISDIRQYCVSEKEPDCCSNCGGDYFVQDPDVLDTWFSSALWPFSTLGWPENNSDLNYYYPTDVLVTGHEILYLWVARMVMMGIEMMGDIPFNNVYIHGIIRDEHGNKMSKSKGNVIDPLETIEEYGTDSLRFALAKSAIPGRDMQLSEDDFIGARNFCNKIWNASRFIISDCDLHDSALPLPEELDAADKWILAGLNDCIASMEECYKGFNNAKAARLVYDFIWRNFCDWYLETAKISLYSDNTSVKTKTRKILVHVLKKTLVMIHPVMPFISSQIWSFLSDMSLAEENILKSGDFFREDYGFDEKDAQIMGRLIEIIAAIRNVRGENGIQPSLKLEAHADASSEDAELIISYKSYILTLAGLKVLELGPAEARSSSDAVAVIGNTKIYLPLPEEMRDQELNRMEKRMAELKNLISGLEKKLENRNFISKAPEEIVESTRLKAELYKQELLNIANNYAGITENT